MLTNSMILIDNATVLDPERGSLAPGQRIYIEEDGIAAVLGPEQRGPDDAGHFRRIDATGLIVVPGLIDAHVHLLAYDTDLGVPERESPLYVAARSASNMRAMLKRGFTTVRDCGGADHGLVRAVDEGHFMGPRIFHGGPALSQTGGHGDFRSAGDESQYDAPGAARVGLVCDGVPEVRRAVRQQIRCGARHIKLMLSGGVSSPTDRVDAVQFAEEEIAAAVEEARNANIYVTAHAFTPEAISRALRLGVRCIEHATLLDDRTAEMFVEHDAFLVPTVAVGALISSPEGSQFGISEAARQKALDAYRVSLSALRIAHERGVKIAFGTDFLGEMQKFQCREFSLRGQIVPALDVLQSATITAAQLLGQDGLLGRVAAGYRADMLLLDKNPLEDISILEDPDHIRMVISRGSVVEANGAI